MPHYFHASCLSEWIERGSASCPICRGPVEVLSCWPVRVHVRVLYKLRLLSKVNGLRLAEFVQRDMETHSGLYTASQRAGLRGLLSRMHEEVARGWAKLNASHLNTENVRHCELFFLSAAVSEPMLIPHFHRLSEEQRC